MKFIDVVDIVVISGNGGNTVVDFFKKKGRLHYGFCISYGGNGGDVWLKTNRNYNTLSHLFFQQVFSAENGQSGRGRGCRGKSGHSTCIYVPLGTRVYDCDFHCLIADLIHDHQELMLVKGGVHGFLNGKVFRSNRSFKSNSIKKNMIGGCAGERRKIRLELLLLADVGILGLPNSGKSTFVRFVSSAKPKVGSYPFTTVKPSLGVVYVRNNHFVVMDVPGLIQGGSKGLGLGCTFLRHLERCRMLLHFVDCSYEQDKVLEDIKVIFHELKSYDRDLIHKPIWLVFNKIDLLDVYTVRKTVNDVVSSLGWMEKYYLVSSKFGYGIKELCCDIMHFIEFM